MKWSLLKSAALMAALVAAGTAAHPQQAERRQDAYGKLSKLTQTEIDLEIRDDQGHSKIQIFTVATYAKCGPAKLGAMVVVHFFTDAKGINIAETLTASSGDQSSPVPKPDEKQEPASVTQNQPNPSLGLAGRPQSTLAENQPDTSGPDTKSSGQQALAAAADQGSAPAVLEMLKAGLSDDQIVANIQSSQGSSSTSTDDLVAVKKAGASDRVIAAMIAAMGTKAGAGAAAGPKDAVATSEPSAGDVRRPPAKIRIAVMDFDYGTVRSYAAAWFGTDVDIGKGIQQMLVTDLVKDGRYSVVERADVDKILAEQNFSNSNRADPNSAAKIGKLLGVDAIIVGTITEFGNETKSTGVGGGGGSGWTGALGGLHHSKSNANVAINARIVNIDSGEIMGVAKGTGTSSRSSTGLGGGGGNWNGHGGGAVDFGSSNFQNTIIGEATKGAVDKLSTDLIADSSKIGVHTVIIEGTIAAVESGQIVLNVGKKVGVKVGDQFNVERVTKEIKDPATGAVIRRLSTTVGVVKATDVDDLSSVCEVVSGTGFKVGDEVKTGSQ